MGNQRIKILIEQMKENGIEDNERSYICWTYGQYFV